MRKRCYDSAAAKQKAYRERKNFIGDAGLHGDQQANSSSAGTVPPTAAELAPETIQGRGAPAGSTPAPRPLKLSEPVDRVALSATEDARIIEGKVTVIDKKIWAYAVVRAERAKGYAAKMPEFIRPGDLAFQDPMWQYERELRFARTFTH